LQLLEPELISGAVIALRIADDDSDRIGERDGGREGKRGGQMGLGL
jgi:hypothetical protein